MQNAVRKKPLHNVELEASLQPSLYIVPKAALFLRWKLHICDKEGSVLLEDSSPFLPFPYHTDICHKKAVRSHTGFVLEVKLAVMCFCCSCYVYNGREPCY